ncbi:GNAT family N-acetyltransferase [Streptomyces sp. NPDC008317]|uniref:GNAT family N-acetyltransferase n=1 Tax=Streptomyces sp. NPDC008317 TaxID=3364827 RepID=UPI0036ECBC3B
MPATSSARSTHEIGRLRDLPTDDSLCRWAAQDLSAGRAFVRGAAVAVAAPNLSLLDRLAVTGPADDAVPLVREVLREVGPSYRPLGDRELIDTVVRAVPSLRPVAGFGWMDRTGPPVGPVPSGDGSARWLPDSAAPEVGALLDTAFPASYAYPGRPGARDRWAGARVDGRLAAVAALTWCAPTVGYVAGVATAAAARGRGLAREVCALVVAEALAVHGTAALIVDDSNAPALRLYRGLGLAYRPLRAAGVEKTG